jgi:hypothetical protein
MDKRRRAMYLWLSNVRKRKAPDEVMNCLDIDSDGKINTVRCDDQFRFSQLFGQVRANKHEL